MHDYLSTGLQQSPISFLKRFHSSYPLVGIGHWGPLFYGAEGIWMLLFGWSRAAVLLLPAAITTSIALALYTLAAPQFGRALGAFCAVAYVASPIVQQDTAALMLDGSVALLCFGAALAYWRYLDTGRAVFSLLFGLLAAAGLLTKGNAACVALLPPFAVLLSREWRLWRRWSFWLPVPVVLLLAGPWYLLTYGQVAVGFRYHWGWDYTSIAVPANTAILLTAFGPLLLPLGLAGFVAVCRAPRGPGGDRFLAAMAALLAAVLTFQALAPAAIQDRYLAPALPPLLLLAAHFLRLVADRFGVRRGPAAAAMACVFCITALPWVLSVAPKPRFGMIEAARTIWAHRLPDNPSVLIATDDRAEGAALAELAMNDTARPSLFAVRGSRLLGGGGYNTHEYEARFQTAQEVIDAIDDYAIPLVLVRKPLHRAVWRHVDQLDQARQAQPDRWELVYEGDQGQVRLYRLRGNDEAKADLGRLRALSAPRSLDALSD